MKLSAHKRGYLTTPKLGSILIIFLMTLILLVQMSYAGSKGKSKEKEKDQKCIVCDSQRDPICKEDVIGDVSSSATTTAPVDDQGSEESTEESTTQQSLSTEKPTASKNVTLGHLAPFLKKCPPRKAWCYKAEGRITTLNYTGHLMYVWKVDRGCAKRYSAEICVRVTQEDETDFRVCYCNRTESCNRNIPVYSWNITKSGSETHHGHTLNQWGFLTFACIFFNQRLSRLFLNMK